MSEQESAGSVSVRAGEGAHSYCHTYDDTTPILTVTAGRLNLSLSIADRTSMPGCAVAFARELATHAALFAAECERLHAVQTDTAAGAASDEMLPGAAQSAA